MVEQSATLVLIRHGQSEWNLRNLFTGWRDPSLTEQGIREAQSAGLKLKQAGINFDKAFSSNLKRAYDSAGYLLEAMGSKLAIDKNAALNERDYGALSGMNKDEARQVWGEEQVHLWRRSFDIAPPEGESLKDTAIRVWPFYFSHIQPYLLRGSTILIAAHGNSLRALIMLLESLSKEEIVKREIATGQPVIYHMAGDLRILTKRELDKRELEREPDKRGLEKRSC